MMGYSQTEWSELTPKERVRVCLDDETWRTVLKVKPRATEDWTEDRVSPPDRAVLALLVLSDREGRWLDSFGVGELECDPRQAAKRIRRWKRENHWNVLRVVCGLAHELPWIRMNISYRGAMPAFRYETQERKIREAGTPQNRDEWPWVDDDERFWPETL